MDNKKKIILVDDHIIVRDGFKKLLESFGIYDIIMELDNGNDLIKALDMDQRLDPDLIILDYEMPKINGLEVMTWMQKKGFKIPVLMLTHNENEKLMIRLFRLGVRGYLNKNCRSAILKEALEEIFSKGYYHNEFLVKALTKETNNITTNGSETVADMLTEREKQFLQWVCDEEEYTYEQIADKLKIHKRTIDNYKQAICEKFNIKSKTGLVLFAIKNKVVEI